MVIDKKKKAPEQFNKKLLLIPIILVLILSIFAAWVIWALENRPPRDKIEKSFSMTLPDNARDLDYWSYILNEQITVARFTVDESDLETTLQSVQWDMNKCLTFERTADYMPDFYQYDMLEWWNPFDAQAYDGVSCYQGDFDDKWTDTHMMVAYQTGEATVYIEEYVPIDGTHPYR